MENFKYSFICAAFNSDKWITRAIFSVLNQSYKNLEFILIVDSKEDKTLTAIEEIKDDRLKVLVQDGKGPFLARKFGVERASGDYLLFLDADDSYKENALEIINNYLEDKSYDFISYGFEYVDKNNNIFKTYSKNYGYKEMNHEGFIEELYLKEIQMSLWNKVYKRDCYKEYKYINNITSFKHGEDYLFSLSFANQIKSALFVDDILYEYRFCNDDSLMISNTNLKSLYEEIFIKYKESFEFLKNKTKNINLFLEKRKYEIYMFLLAVELSNLKNKKEIKQKIRKEILFLECLKQKQPNYFYLNLFNKHLDFLCKIYSLLFKIRNFVFCKKLNLPKKWE